MNQADAQVAESFVRLNGFTVTEESQADTIVVFSCAVRNETEDRIVSDAKKFSRLGKRVVITSCLANSRPGRLKEELPSAIIMRGGDSEGLIDAIRARPGSILHGGRTLSLTGLEATTVTRVYPVKISQGCTSNCHFCITKLARPTMWCRPSAEIEQAVRNAVGRGAVEIDLTSMDNADYLEPPSIRLPQLVERIVSAVRGNYMIRVGMMNPSGALGFWNELEVVLKHDKVFKFLHLPIQAGDARVVRSMNRDYDPWAVVDEVRRIKANVAGLRVATDVMVGYPAEDEDAFRNTLSLVESGAFDKVHMFRFTPRPHTRASFLDQLDERVKKRRSEQAAKAVERVHFSKLSSLVGSDCEVLVTAAREGERCEGRTTNYAKVYLPCDPGLLGGWVHARIIGATSEHLVGEPVR
jgi:MiaB/RimO family radical SAM methylthiotransferase